MPKPRRDSAGSRKLRWIHYWYISILGTTYWLSIDWYFSCSTRSHTGNGSLRRKHKVWELSQGLNTFVEWNNFFQLSPRPPHKPYHFLYHAVLNETIYWLICTCTMYAFIGIMYIFIFIYIHISAGPSKRVPPGCEGAATVKQLNNYLS